MEDHTVHFCLHFVEQGPKYLSSNMQWDVGQWRSAPRKRCDIPIVSVLLRQTVNTIFSQGFPVNSYKTWKILCSDWDCLGQRQKKKQQTQNNMPAGTLRSTGGMWCLGGVQAAGTLQRQCRLFVLHLLPSSCHSCLPPPSTDICVALQCHRSQRRPTRGSIYKAIKVELRKISMLKQ